MRKRPSGNAHVFISVDSQLGKNIRARTTEQDTRDDSVEYDQASELLTSQFTKSDWKERNMDFQM
ncbi:MAG: hypothetical protein ACK2UO_06150, partial [Caldilineaceae bacterium]